MKNGIASLEWKVAKMQNNALGYYLLAPSFFLTFHAICVQTSE
jgi:hypothetical protein